MTGVEYALPGGGSGRGWGVYFYRTIDSFERIGRLFFCNIWFLRGCFYQLAMASKIYVFITNMVP